MRFGHFAYVPIVSFRCISTLSARVLCVLCCVSSKKASRILRSLTSDSSFHLQFFISLRTLCAYVHQTSFRDQISDYFSFWWRCDKMKESLFAFKLSQHVKHATRCMLFSARLASLVSPKHLPVDVGGDLGEFSLSVGCCSSQQKQPETASKLTQRRLMSVRMLWSRNPSPFL